MTDQIHLGSTIASLYDRAIKRFADREAIVFGDTRLTYREFGEQVSQFIQLFKSFGLGRGQGLAMLSGNRPEVIAVMAACHFIGIRYTPLHPLGSIEDHLFVLEDAEISALVVDADAYPARERAVPSLQAVITFGNATFGVRAEDLLPKFKPQPLTIESRPEDIAHILYTGGTTGRPKGVVQRHGQWLNNMKLLLSEREYPHPPRFLVSTPISHAGSGNIAPTQLRGGVLVLQKSFNAVEFMAAIERERINATLLVPTALYNLLDHPRLKEFDLSSLQMLVYGGSPISPSRLDQAIEAFGPIFCQLYAQTECGSITYLSKADHVANARRRESCGLPIIGQDVVLLDPDGVEVAPGEVGEICVRGPNVMEGYWKRPEDTAEAFRGGWHHTGDLATQDEDGYYYIVGRAKDMIVTGGFNVYPREVEDVVSQHEAVAACAVIGVPDPKWGEAVTAFVVLHEDRSASGAELTALVKLKKGPIYAPKAVNFVAELPMTALNKIDKKALRSRFWDGETRQVG
ncbi:AMP-binding protein [Phenylobacterium sp.]|uniref:AMP-binding protein n=1 Tax=Phenylobacterium sp. TaxID=1871053 RepID=UPI00301E14A0